MNRSLFLLIVFLVTVLASSSWAATTYTFTSSTYSIFTPFSVCVTGPCANYTTAMKISGSFTVATAVPPNAPGGTDITSSIIAYSFSDGINTYANTDPNSRIYDFKIATDGSGNVSSPVIVIERWLTGTSPHAVNDRFSLLNMNGPPINIADNNLYCALVGTSSISGVADLCNSGNQDTGFSTASINTGTWTTSAGSPSPMPGTPAPPTALLILTGLAGVGLFQAIRKQARS